MNLGFFYKLTDWYFSVSVCRVRRL